MQIWLKHSLSLRAVAAVAIMAGLPLIPAPVAASEVSAAADGRALQAVLDATPAAREAVKDAVAARAKELGLALVEVSVGSAAGHGTELRVAGGAKPFADCPAGQGCPSLVAIPPSPPGFAIGSPESEKGRSDDETLTEVSIRAFAMSATPVTVRDYLACVTAGGCKHPEWLEPDGQHNVETGSSRYYRNLGEAITGPDQPIVGVSHVDATAYAAWLAKLTGQSYRLPSEAEWEFAARAGTKTAYWWGDAMPDDGVVRAACEGCGSAWDAKSPAPAAQFPANPWGLHNVHGNVWEWVADFYCDDYASGPKDGSPRLVDGACAPVGDRPPARGVRTLRGGSAFYPPKAMRSAMRVRNVPEFRNFSVGFRVARDLVPR